MPTRRPRLRARLHTRLGALLLASAMVVLAWCAVGGAQAASASGSPSTAVVSSMQGPASDDGGHAASIDQGSRAAAVHVHQVAPDVVPAPVTVLAAPRASRALEPGAERAPPSAGPTLTSGSRAPPA